MNTSGIQPVEYNVLVKPKGVEKKTAGGVFIPEQRLEREEYAQTSGMLVAASPAAFTFNYEGWPDGAEPPKAGDQVYFTKYEATKIDGSDGETYWLMKDKSITAVAS
jgi:co-chaperonin GroES (HSP10)